MSGIASIPDYSLPKYTKLPKNLAHWKIDPDRSVLLVHDMQRYFLAPFSEAFQSRLIEKCSTLVKHSRTLRMPIFYTAQPGSMSEKERGLLKDIWGPGMKASPEDREIVEELKPRSEDTVLTKWRYSAFCRSNLQEQIISKNRDQLIICGVYGHVGIMATAIEAFSHDIQPFLVADAIGDFTAEYHWMTLNYSASRCAVVTTVKEAF